MLLQSLLEPLGFCVTCADNGLEGLELLNSRDHLPDLILLDVEMPGMSGLEVCYNSFASVYRPAV
jgi:CheY-like chemotaxis protein